MNEKVNWTKEEDEVTKNNQNTVPSKIVRLLKNKSKIDIQKRKVDLFGLKNNHMPWEDNEIEILKSNSELIAKDFKKLIPYKSEGQIRDKKKQLEKV